jgi:hypothetical protein
MYSTAMGYQTTASEQASTAMGHKTTASEMYSTAMGNGTTASGVYSTAMGFGTDAVGRASTAMGYLTSAEAESDTAMGKYSIAQGGNSTAMGHVTKAYGVTSLAWGTGAIADANFSAAMGYYVTCVNTGSFICGRYGDSPDVYSFSLGNGTATDAKGLAFKVLTDGNVSADGTFTGGGADFAEYFEWLDGNPDGEDRAGYFVTLDFSDGEGKIRKANAGEKIHGVISANPTIAGDGADLRWNKKFMTDDFGRIQYQDVTIPAVYEDAKTLPDGTETEPALIAPERVERQPILNPDWNPETVYVPRKDRPEWDAVGAVGKLIVYDDGTLNPEDLCAAGDGGRAVKSVDGAGFTVLKRVAGD